MRNANGTGPYRLERYEPDVRTVLKTQPALVGLERQALGQRRRGRLADDPLRRDAAGGADLRRGRPGARPAVPGRRAAEERRRARPCCRRPTSASSTSPSTRRATSSQDSDVKGRNPFKDMRVRRAVYHAINVDLIVAEGAARPGARRPAPTCRRASTARRPSSTSACRYDPAKARALLAEAGYPNGFSVTLDCVNIAWREAVCQAMTAMLTQVGIRTTLRSSATNQFFPKLTPGHRQPRRVRLDADRRRLGVAERAVPHLGQGRPRHLQRRPLLATRSSTR